MIISRGGWVAAGDGVRRMARRTLARGFVALLAALAGGACGGDETTQPAAGVGPTPTSRAATGTTESTAAAVPAGFDVVGPGAAPIANVRAEFLSHDGAVVGGDVSSERGRVAWPAAGAAAESVRLSKSGWETQTVPLAELRGRAGAGIVTLRPTTLLTVSAVADDSQPDAGVQVSAVLETPPAPAGDDEVSGVTDATGELRLEGLHEGRWRVSASGLDREILSVSPTLFITAGKPAQIRVRTRLIEQVAATVTTPTGEQVALAFVSPDTEFAGGAKWTAQVQADGRLVVPERPSVLSQRLGVIGHDGTRYIATLVPGSKPPRYEVGEALPERPDSEAMLTGTVTSQDGAPLRALVVAMEGTVEEVFGVERRGEAPRQVEAMTRPDGTFRMFDVPFRRAAVFATLATGTGLTRGHLSSQARPVDVELPRAGVALVIECGASIRGTLLDAQGAPVVGAQLEFVRIGGSGADAQVAVAPPLPGYASVTTTGEAGAFAVEGIEPGRYRVRPYGRSAPGWIDATVTAGAVPVELRCAERREIRCRVVDLRGRPVPGAAVAAIVRDDREKSRTELTNDQGVALIRGLDPAERYVVEAAIGDFSTTVADPAAPGLAEYDAQVDVEPILRIRVTAPQGVAVGGRRVRVLRDPQVLVCSARTGPDGTFELLRPPAGRYEIRLDEGADIEAATTSISFPDTREAVLECVLKPKK